MRHKIEPKNYLRVFVSSAQRNEGSFDWGEVRARIVEKIRTCPFLIPFIMEESGSELPSVQRFTYNPRLCPVLQKRGRRADGDCFGLCTGLFLW